MKLLPCAGHSYGDRAVCTVIMMKNMSNKGEKCEDFSFRGRVPNRYYIDTKSMPPRLYSGNNTDIYPLEEAEDKAAWMQHFIIFFIYCHLQQAISIGDLQESKVNVMFFQKPHVGRHKKPRDQVKFSDGKALGHTTCAQQQEQQVSHLAAWSPACSYRLNQKGCCFCLLAELQLSPKGLKLRCFRRRRKFMCYLSVTSGHQGMSHSWNSPPKSPSSQGASDFLVP